MIHLHDWGSHFTWRSTSARSEMEMPSRDGNTNTSHSCHLKVKPPRGWSFHITNQTRSKQLLHFYYKITCNYISLNFIMSLHLTSKMHEIFTSLCLLFEKKYKRPGNLSCHHLQTLDIISTKICSSVEIFSEQTSSLQRFLRQALF